MANWPIEKGFDNDWEQHEPVALTVKGDFPAYAAGVLYRTGPIGYKIQTEEGKTWEAGHWFDGLSCVHKFKIDCYEGEPAQVTYQSRRTCDEYLEIVKKTGTVDGITFGAKRDPCKSIFAKIFTMYTATRSTKNIGVTLSINLPGFGYVKDAEKASANGHSNSNGIQTLHAKTDNMVIKKINPETLEPEGIAVQTSLHPDLVGQLSASHAKSDPVTGDVFNFNLKLGPISTYRVFRTNASTGTTDILATFTGKPCYIHSIFLTENHVVLCIWNSHLTWGGISVLYHKNMHDAIMFDPSKKAMWYVIDRTPANKGLVAIYESDPFFCFHTVNAFETPSPSDPSKIDIITELSGYDNTDVIHSFYYQNLINMSKDTTGKKKSTTCLPWQAQYRLASVNSGVPHTTVQPAERLFKSDKAKSMELPTINPLYLTKRHRYSYGCTDRGKSAFMDGIIKFDNVTQDGIIWECEGHTPGEAIFVADPEGTAEDDGVLLSVVLDGFVEKSYLLCLNAKDLSVLGRADMPEAMAFGFHGVHKAHGRVYGGDV